MSAATVRLAIAVPERSVVSESFIAAHINGLFGDAVVIWGSPRPLFHGDGSGVLSGVWAAVARALSLAPGMTHERSHGAVVRRLPDSTYATVLARHLDRSGVDVVLAEYGPTAVAVMEACAISKTPLVAHFHGYDAYQYETLSHHRDSYARLFQTAARIVVVSEHMRNHLVGLGSPEERTVCNPCGVDVDRFQGGRPGEAPPLLLALGRFVDKKGPLLTLRAFARVQANEPPARLVMLGDGPLRAECIELARELSVDRQVEFPGSIDHAEVVGWMRRARCFVQHSLQAPSGDREGTPVAVLEASSCGLPVVSTRHGGITEAVIDGESGFLVAEGDVEGMAAHILRLLREPGLADAMGAAGRRHVVSNYSSEASLGRLRTVLIEGARSGV